MDKSVILPGQLRQEELEKPLKLQKSVDVVVSTRNFSSKQRRGNRQKEALVIGEAVGEQRHTWEHSQRGRDSRRTEARGYDITKAIIFVLVIY